jgi:hypothetical protein
MPWMQVEVVTATVWEHGGSGDREGVEEGGGGGRGEGGKEGSPPPPPPLQRPCDRFLD